MILGLRTILYRVPDIDAAKTWYRAILERDPYFDEPYYVGFNVGGFELGLNPDEAGGAPGPGGTVAYWGVKDARAAVKRLRGLGVVVASDPEDVGGVDGDVARAVAQRVAVDAVVDGDEAPARMSDPRRVCDG